MTDTEKAIEITQRQIEELKSNLPTLVTQEYYDSFNLAIEVKQKAIQALQEKAEREKGCEYCDFSSGDVGATINTSGDDFVMIADDEEKSITLATDDKHFRTLKINNCPMCGRKLNNAPTDEH